MVRRAFPEAHRRTAGAEARRVPLDEAGEPVTGGETNGCEAGDCETAEDDSARPALLARAAAIHRTDRIACVALPAFPLQLVLRRQPDWRGEPAAVVEQDNPLAPLLWVNEAALRVGILPGMRYAAALSVDHRLRATTVTDTRRDKAVAALHRHLLRYSPRVEPAGDDPGVFWLDAGGLERVDGTPRQWAARLWQSLQRAHFTAGVTVGYSRFGTCCLSRAHREVLVLDAPAAEQAACRRVPLSRLDLAPAVRDDLTRLGLKTIDDLLRLPAAGLGARFGAGTLKLVQLARGLGFDPLQPALPPEPVRAEEHFDEPETDAWRLLFVIKRRLHPLLARLADETRAVALLRLELRLADRAGTLLSHDLRPAAPTLDVVLLTELVRLRLENLDLAAGVERVTVSIAPAAAPAEALELFRRRPRRDPEAALRAVARLRAEMGDSAVARAELRPGHLPEQGYGWRDITGAVAPEPAAMTATATAPRPQLVRRVLPRPRPLVGGGPELILTDPAQLVRAAATPGVPALGQEALRAHGPFLLSGGWWSGEVRRAYHYLEADGGRVLWLFHAEAEQRWYLHGFVE
ncbi:MAG: DNA polymerase Y family protein [bacterium]|nr:DNA polymerase Y family protein [bacterium]